MDTFTVLYEFVFKKSLFSNIALLFYFFFGNRHFQSFLILCNTMSEIGLAIVGYPMTLCLVPTVAQVINRNIDTCHEIERCTY